MFAMLERFIFRSYCKLYAVECKCKFSYLLFASVLKWCNSQSYVCQWMILLWKKKQIW